jgi:invasion protein IalB
VSERVLFGAATCGAIIFLGLGSLALGQTSKSADPVPAAKPAPSRTVDTEPNNTSASFGDWVMRCQRLADGAETQRLCEVAQQIQPQGQQNPIAELAIGRLKKTDPLRLTLVLPVNVTFPSPPTLSTDGNELDPIDLGWRKCVPGGCFSDALLKDDVLRRWRTQTGAGRIAWKDSAGRDATIGLSFRGLGQALDALSKQP